MAVILDTKPPEKGTLPGLGRVYAPDPDDHKFLLPRRLTTARTFRNWLVPGEVLDQGSTSMCVAYAGGKYAAAHRVVNAVPDLPTLYNDCQKNDEWEGEDYDGTSVRALMRIFKLRGMVSRYQWAFDVDTLLFHVLETGPVVMGTDWYMDMFMPGFGGYIYPTGEVVGGHAWMITCVNVLRPNPDGTQGAVRMQNSWGPNWGQNGRAWIRLADLPLLLENYGEAAMATEIKLAA